MKSEKTFTQKVRQGCCAAAVLSACMMAATSCDRYDLDQYLPDGWGSSIYNKLEDEGNYTNTLRLIQDLGQQEVLSKTGSKTLFVADDDAFQRFYANNKWGVRSYDQLTLSQKKLLLNGAMINNSYQISTLSSAASADGTTVVEGQCVRRATASTIYDSVSVVNVEDLPNMSVADQKNNSCWAKFKGRGKIALMKDMTAQPMVHFIEDYITNNNFLNSDINYLFNNKIDRQAGDAVINGDIVTEQNIKCSNGFIHKMQDVILPLDNMAELIHNNPETSVFSKMMDRFCAPYYVGKTVTDQYNRICGTSVDSVFQKRYFSSQSERELKEEAEEAGSKVHQELLNYDPGWNGYYVDKRSGESNEQSLSRDMAFILAPSNEAFQNYWKTTTGQLLMVQYGSVENIPNSVIKELVNNNLQSSFRLKGVESKFGSILNDANDPMNVDPSSVDTVMMGCNGVVYVTNKVYSPTSFVSVKYPTVVNKNMKIFDWAIYENQYSVYLNSLNAYYSFFIPDNNALLKYVNPASFGKKTQEVYAFHYDESLSVPVWATIYAYNPTTHEIGDSIGENRSKDDMRDLLKDVLDNCIVVNKDVEDGHQYYITKAGTYLRIKDAKMGEKNMTVAGSYQVNDFNNSAVTVSKIYDQTQTSDHDGNGKCYVLSDWPILTTSKSVLEMMDKHEEMQLMHDLIIKCGLTETLRNMTNTSPNKQNISCFNSYNYTIYVPTSSSIQALFDSGKLPSLEKIEKEKEEGNMEMAIADSLTLLNFVRYHIQDNALMVGATPQAQSEYETASINSKGKFDRIFVTLTDDNIYIEGMTSDGKADGKPVHLLKSGGLYNMQAREYFLNGADADQTNITMATTSSSAVIHLIEKPLLYK